MDPIGQYDQLYSNSPCVRGMAPSVFALEVLSRMTGSTVLDLGCGEGQDAVAFAETGFVVTAVDASPAAIAHAKTLARKKKVQITFECAEAISFLARSELYDSIYADAFLHFFPLSNLVELIGMMQRCTNPGGINAIGVFDKRTTPAESRSLAEWGICFETDTQIRSLYSEWHLVDEKMLISERKNGEVRGITQLIYRKPFEV